MYAVVMFLKTVWDSHGVFVLPLKNFFVSNSQSKKFELIQKSYVPRALRFSCQGRQPAKRSEKGYGDENEVDFIQSEKTRVQVSAAIKLTMSL